MSKSAAKALRDGIGGDKKRRISTFLFARPGAIRAFATDLDNLRRRGPSRRAVAGRTATMAGTPAISRTAAPPRRASISRAGGTFDAKDPVGIATTPRDAPRDEDTPMPPETNPGTTPIDSPGEGRARPPPTMILWNAMRRRGSRQSRGGQQGREGRQGRPSSRRSPARTSSTGSTRRPPAACAPASTSTRSAPTTTTGTRPWNCSSSSPAPWSCARRGASTSSSRATSSSSTPTTATPRWPPGRAPRSCACTSRRITWPPSPPTAPSPASPAAPVPSGCRNGITRTESTTESHRCNTSCGCETGP